MSDAGETFKNPAESVPLGWPRLQAYLRAHGLRPSPEPAPRQFAGGLANVNYLLELDGEPVVLRRPPPGPQPPGAYDMAREHRVLSALHAHFPLAPRALLLCADPSVIGAPFLLMEYRPGLIVRDRLPPALAGAGRPLGEALVDTLVALHALDPGAVGLGDLGRPQGFLARTRTGWIERARLASDGAPSSAARAAAARLAREPVPEGASATFIHNDFKLDNVVLDATAPVRPRAVLDWDMATRGDPLFDLAVLVSYWTEAGDPPVMHALAQMPSAAPGFPSRAEALARYRHLSGRDLSAFPFYRLLALYRLAVVFLQLHARYRHGATRDPRFARFGALAEGLFELACDSSYS